MGNRIFLYTTDRLPDPADPDAEVPQAIASVGEAKNGVPPLWRVMLSGAFPGPAQDEQQVFLPSQCNGFYTPRALAEERMFRLLDFVAQHPALPDPDAFRARTEALRAALAEVEGAAYCADLNELYYLDSDGSIGPDAWLDAFAADCARHWEETERAMARGAHDVVAEVNEFEPEEAAGMLGFECWLVGRQRGADDDFEERYLGAGMQKIAENDKVGVYHFHKEQVVVPPILDAVYPFEEGAATAALDGRWGYLDLEGNWLVAPRYDDAYDFANGMAQVVQGGLAGYVDASGKEAIAPRFLLESGSFVEAGFACVQLDSGYGVIDRTGALVIPAVYAEIDWIDSLDAWQATKGEECAVFHADGRPWFTGRYDEMFGLSAGGDAILERDGKLGTWQRSGAPGLPLEFDDIDELETPGETTRERLYVVGLQGDGGRKGAKARKGLHDAAGGLLIPAEYSRIQAVTVLRRGAAELEEVAGEYFALKRHGGGGLGLWSRTANGVILPFDYRAFYGVATAKGIFLAALCKKGGWVLADAQGRLLHTGAADWFVEPGYKDGHEWMMPELLSEIAQAWDADKPILAGRGDALRCLGSDGGDEDEVDYLLRMTRNAPPIVAPRGMLGRLFSPDFLNERRHCIEGAGDPDSCARLGDIHAFGLGVRVDQVAALRWYATAARGGHEGARYQYAYYLAEGIACKPNPAAAREQLAGLGQDHASAQNLLGRLYEHGLGGPADPVQARACYERAARGGMHGLAEAQLNAGDCWKLGIGGPIDKQKAIDYIEMAAARGAPRTEVYPEALWGAAQLNADLALEAHEAGKREQHEMRLERAIGYYWTLVSLGDHGGLVGVARCHLGVYGGTPNLEQARACLDRTAGTDAAGQARSLRQEHGL